LPFSEETRRKIFDNARGHCESCKKQIVFKNHEKGQRVAWMAHHKTAESSGGKDIASNGKTLCLDCHKRTYTYGRH
jgi:predicted CXXCH cytochrome family protein